MKRVVRVGLPALALAAAGALALPLVRATGSSGCQPANWMDWHLAMRQQCLEPGYVCQHMTSAEMMRDPEIAAAYREGLAAGRPEPVQGLARMVGRMRARYGCEPEAAEPETAEPETAGPASPADRLPPGHPPVDGVCPFAGPEARQGAHPAGPLPFTFEAAPTTTL